LAGIGIVIVIAAVIASMAIAMFTYTQFQTNFIEVAAGEPVTVGPVEYIVTFDGTHKGNKETIPENTFVKIRIVANNISQEETRMSGGQFYLIDEKEQKHEAVYGEFSDEDLYGDYLEPGKPISRTTQFDVPYNEQKQYDIVIRPTKEQSTVDTAMICLTNC
jgi:ABC-type lipoprotein release transport system permease subunit